MSCPHLAATEATVDWDIRELHREEDKAENDDSYLPALSRLLCSANPKLIAPRADQILQAPGFFKIIEVRQDSSGNEVGLHW